MRFSSAFRKNGDSRCFVEKFDFSKKSKILNIAWLLFSDDYYYATQFGLHTASFDERILHVLNALARGGEAPSSGGDSILLSPLRRRTEVYRVYTNPTSEKNANLALGVSLGSGTYLRVIKYKNVWEIWSTVFSSCVLAGNISIGNIIRGYRLFYLCAQPNELRYAWSFSLMLWPVWA